MLKVDGHTGKVDADLMGAGHLARWWDETKSRHGWKGVTPEAVYILEANCTGDGIRLYAGQAHGDVFVGIRLREELETLDREASKC